MHSTLHDRDAKKSMAGAIQMIAVLITFRKSTKNSLHCNASTYSQVGKKKVLYVPTSYMSQNLHSPVQTPVVPTAVNIKTLDFFDITLHYIVGTYRVSIT
jgi:hypothetical protein